MKNLVIWIIVAALSLLGCTSPTARRSSVDVQGIEKAISRRMNLDNFLSGDWSVGFVREMRIVPLTSARYLVAFEVATNDFPLSEDIRWQVATVDFDGARTVDFPGQPCSPDTLRSNLYLVDGVGEAQVEMLQTGVGCVHTQFVFERQRRAYHHGKVWKTKIAALEEKLQDFVTEEGIRQGMILVGDFENTDEEVEGMGLDSDRGFCWRLKGVLLKSRSMSHPVYSAVYSEREDEVHPRDLSKLLSAPLLWNVSSTNGRSVLTRDEKVSVNENVFFFH